jgi:hypothetical protein
LANKAVLSSLILFLIRKLVHESFAENFSTLS